MTKHAGWNDLTLGPQRPVSRCQPRVLYLNHGCPISNGWEPSHAWLRVIGHADQWLDAPDTTSACLHAHMPNTMTWCSEGMIGRATNVAFGHFQRAPWAPFLWPDTSEGACLTLSSVRSFSRCAPKSKTPCVSVRQHDQTHPPVRPITSKLQRPITYRSHATHRRADRTRRSRVRSCVRSLQWPPRLHKQCHPWSNVPANQQVYHLMHVC
jgi:hypothetical protein